MALPDYYGTQPEDFTDRTAFTPVRLAGRSGLVYNGTLSAFRLQPAASEEEAVWFDTSPSSYTECYVSSVILLTGPSGVSTRGFIQLNGATGDLIRLVTIDTSETSRVEIWNGATWATIGDTFSLVSTGDYRIDIYFKIADAGGRIRVRVNGVPVVDFTGDTKRTADTTIDEVKWSSHVDNGHIYDVSACMVHSTDLANVRMIETNINVTGTFSNLSTGNYLGVDDLLYQLDDGETFNTAIVDGGGATYETETLSTQYTASTILGVVDHIRFKAAADPMLYIKSRNRKASTNYDLGPGIQRTVADSFGHAKFGREVDPSTGVAWASFAAIEAMEMGFVLDTTS